MTLLYNSKNISEITTRDNLSISRVLFGSVLVYSKGFEPITFTDNATWVIPSGIKQINVDCVAAQGNSGGLGGRVQCVLKVTPGQLLYIVVGKVPTNYWTAEYNASDIRTSADDLNSRLIVAGGGGSRCNHIASGGAGGGLVGGSGTSTGYVTAGTGGTQAAGGTGGRNTVAVKVGHAHDVANGGFGLGSNGNVCGYEGNGGAGGAGWYGGGGGSGAWNKNGAFTSTGGGGSSYTDPDACTNIVHTQGYQSGNGYVTLSML